MKKHASRFLTDTISIFAALACLSEVTSTRADGPVVPTPAPTTAAAPALPLGATEVVKMYQGGISKDVLVGFVENSTLPFHLTADGIIYLQHLGLPQDVTSVMIKRDGEIQRQMAAAYQTQSQPAPQAQQPMQSAANTQSQVIMPATPAPANPYPAVVNVPQTVYPDYDAYPYYYGYPYYYSPGVIVGGGIGWGWGHGWDRGFHGGFGHGGFSHGGGGFSHGGGGFGHGGHH